MFCKNCGAQIPDQSSSCPNCGMQMTANGQALGNSYGNPNDVPSTGLNILSCCIPLVGLILYLVWKDQTPVKAKSVGKWALIGVGISVVCYVLYFILILTLGVASAGFSSILLP